MDVSSDSKNSDEPKDPGGSPDLSKKLGSLSINLHSSPKAKDQRSSSSVPHSPKSPLLRKASSNSLLQRHDDRPSSRRALSSTFSPPHPASEEKPPLTAAAVAAEYFGKELARHEASLPTDTLVLMHSNCYRHRFSRLRSSKATLSSIVERPERLKAAALGVASAYVRLGQRYECSLQEQNQAVPFHIHTTSRDLPITSPAVINAHGGKWMQELESMCKGAEAKLAAGANELIRPETATGDPLHSGDLYLCKESLDALEGALGAVCEAVDRVFDDDDEKEKAFVCIRPPGHHCSTNWPSGFCWINNVFVGLEYATQARGLTHAAIIDFDLHHGDGTQAIAVSRPAQFAKPQKQTAKTCTQKRSSVGYYSLHDINSFPCEDDLDKVQSASVCIENAHGQNIWNVHLEKWTTEEEFWQLYEKKYTILLEKASKFLKTTTRRLQATTQPKGAIFISAGFDASVHETPHMQRHGVNVPTDFYARFTSDIVKLSREEGTGVNGRVVSVFEGGYSDRAITSGVLSHIAGLASTPHSNNSQASNDQTPQEVSLWDRGWWSTAALQELEDHMKPIALPPPRSKKPSGPKEVPTYQTPTQSFTAKVVDPTKISRHTSINMPTPPKSRPVTPPAPEVDWATAVHEMAKLMIPSDTHQVDSCTHEELNPPKKQERHSSTSLQTLPQSDRMQTRGRKAKEDATADIDSGNRRRTISDLSALDEKKRDKTEPIATGIKPSSRPQSRAGPRPSSRNDGLKVSRTRRTSASKEVLPKTTTDVPPVPELPKSQKDSDDKASNTDVDAIASGISKIMLKLPKPSEDARSKPEAAGAPKRTARKPTAPRIPKPSAAKSAGSKAGLSVSKDTAGDKAGDEQKLASEKMDLTIGKSSSAGSAPADAEGSTVLLESSQATAGMQPDPVDPSVPDLQFQPGAHNSDALEPIMPGQKEAEAVTNHSVPIDTKQEFVPYAPPNQQDSSLVPAGSNFHQQPLQFLPPNTNTPPKPPLNAGKEALPVFTAKGHIPFSGGQHKHSDKADADPAPVSEVETSVPILEPSATDKVQSGGVENIWDVPDTPHHG